MENTVHGRGVLAEHGLSFLIEIDGHRLLLDTGQGLAIRNNAERFGVDLSAITALILSHGHYDHTGGIASLPKRREPCPVYVHPAAFGPKYSLHEDGSIHDVGMPLSSRSVLDNGSCRLELNKGPNIASGCVLVTGEVPRQNAYEDTGGAFYTDEACTAPDRLIDDQAVAIHTSEGVVLLLSCAHAGTVNTMDFVAGLLGVSRFRAVIGGMHLLDASGTRIAATIEAFRRYDVGIVGPCHCTGDRAVRRMQSELPDRFRVVESGTRLVFG